MMGAMV
jgi:hypothetical protein